MGDECCGESSTSSPCILLGSSTASDDEEEDDERSSMSEEKWMRGKRQEFVESCLRLRPATVDFYEKKLAKRSKAHALALAQAEREFCELSRAHAELEVSAEARLRALRQTLERQAQERLKKELARRDAAFAKRLAEAARLRERERLEHSRQLEILKEKHEVQRARKDVAYATLSRKYDELKITLDTVAAERTRRLDDDRHPCPEVGFQ